jgi:hypothetical protein
VTLIAEDLLLLLLDDRSGKPQTAHLEIALGGAVLVDLALEGLVEVAGHGSLLSSAKLRRTPGSTSGDRILAGALGAVAENQAAQRLVVKVGKGLVDPLAERQRRRGVLDRREEKVLGLVTRTRCRPGTRPARRPSAARSWSSSSSADGPTPGVPRSSGCCWPCTVCTGRCRTPTRVLAA